MFKWDNDTRRAVSDELTEAIYRLKEEGSITQEDGQKLSSALGVLFDLSDLIPRFQKHLRKEIIKRVFKEQKEAADAAKEGEVQQKKLVLKPRHKHS